ncbi:2073_t:CDS:2, partial [Acaulospora colombiana]
MSHIVLESLKDRIPVEIWVLIFHHACANSNAFPFIDETRNRLSTSVIRNFNLFKYSFRPSLLIQPLEDFLKTLRSVCRKWAAIVERLPRRHLFISTDPKNFAYPSNHVNNLPGVEVIHLIGEYIYSYCLCPSRASRCRDRDCETMKKLERLPFQKFWEVEEPILRTQLHNVKAIFLRSHSPESERILKAATNIHALHASCFDRSFEPIASLVTRAKYLTHLSLATIPCESFFSFYLDGSATLPSVQYLDISFMRSWSFDSPSNHPNKLPLFPHLKTLKISGDIDNVFQSAAQDFLIECGRTVEEFVECPLEHWERQWVSTFTTLFSYFPDLHLYGASLQNLVEDLGPVQTFLANPEISNRLLTLLLARWKVTKLVIPETWENFSGILMQKRRNGAVGDSAIARFKKFVEFIKVSSVSFCDSEGILVQNAIQRTLGTLRLVCRLWCSILQGLHRICVITDLNALNYPGRSIEVLEGVERIEIISDRASCFCSGEEHCLHVLEGLIPSMPGQAGWWEDLANERLEKFLLRIMVFSFGNWGGDVEKLMALMPNLQALEVEESK